MLAETIFKSSPCLSGVQPVTGSAVDTVNSILVRCYSHNGRYELWGPEIEAVVLMKAQVLQCLREHLDWSLEITIFNQIILQIIVTFKLKDIWLWQKSKRFRVSLNERLLYSRNLHGSTIVFHSVLLPTSGANHLSYATKQLKKETLVVSETGLASSTVKQFLSELNTMATIINPTLRGSFQIPLSSLTERKNPLKTI